jgi:hypothetical protein
MCPCPLPSPPGDRPGRVSNPHVEHGCPSQPRPNHPQRKTGPTEMTPSYRAPQPAQREGPLGQDLGNQTTTFRRPRQLRNRQARQEKQRAHRSRVLGFLPDRARVNGSARAVRQRSTTGQQPEARLESRPRPRRTSKGIGKSPVLPSLQHSGRIVVQSDRKRGSSKGTAGGAPTLR